jgi:hypothetical protein
MKKCKIAIENPTDCGKNICCFECEDKENCPDSCSLLDNLKSSDECEEAFSSENELIVFEEKAITIMQSIANIATQKVALEEQDKLMRRELETAMEQYGVKSFENDILKITYVEPTTRTSVDSAKLKKKYPSVFEECSKTSEVKGSDRITVK